MNRRCSLKQRRTDPPDRQDSPVNIFLAVDEANLSLLSRSDTFHGACLNTGAQKTVIGKQQAEAYVLAHGDRRPMGPPRPNVFRFGGGRHPSVATLTVRMPITQDFFLILTIDVVELSVPLLLGLEKMDQHRLYFYNTTNKLVCVNEGVILPVVRKLGHAYYQWGPEVLYTYPELQKIHKHFFHAKPERLYNVMKRAEVANVVPETLKQLQDVASACDVCQRLAREPSRFRVALPEEDTCFNRLVYVDLMFVEQQAVLHAVDSDTLFSAATILNGQSAAEVWEAFMLVWVTPLVGYPEELHVDAGSQLRSASFLALLSSSGVKMRPSGVESHNALGAGERYHAYLRQLFKRVRADHPKIPVQLALSMAVWAMNQTAGPRGLSPILLVFGIHPRMPVSPADLPNHRERCKALVEARADMSKQIARDRLDRALRTQVPHAAAANINPGIDVLVYREKPVDKWEGPYRVISCSSKQVWLDVNNKAKMFSIDKVKEYLPPPVTGTDGEPSQTAAKPTDEQVGSILDGIIAGDTLVAEISRRVGELRDKAYRSTTEEPQTPGDICITEVLKAGDPRILLPGIQGARRKEADGLMRRGAFEKVPKASVPGGATVLGARFVDAFKKVGTNNEMPKSRLVGQGHRDRAKPFIVHSASDLRQSSTRLLVSSSAVLGFRLFLHDVD